MNFPRIFVAAAIVVLSFTAPSVASAQTAVSASEEAVVLPTIITPDKVAPVETGVGGGEEVLGETVVRGIAITGTDVVGLVALGSAALVGGASVLATRRRRLA